MAGPEHVRTDITAEYKPVWDRGLLGAGITIAVPDTGAGEAARHFAAEQAKLGHADIPFGQLETIDVPGASADSGDGGEHAYQVLRRILFVAPAARVLDLPIFRGMPSRDIIMRAMDIAYEHDADVLNMSLGEKVPLASVGKHYDACPLGRHAEAQVTKRDVLVVAAAGNFRAENAIACPGLAPGVISVGAHLSPEESRRYRKYPHKAQEDFLEGWSGTSFAAALQSATLALFRSAFPGIRAVTWNDIVFASTDGALVRATPTPLDFFNYLRDICGGDWVNSVQWRELRTIGITRRRQLLALSKLAGKEIADLPTLLELQRERSDQFAAAVRDFVEGREQFDDPSKEIEAIEHFRRAARGFAALSLNVMAASALLRAGAGLVQRVRTVSGALNTTFAIEGGQALTEALNLLEMTTHPEKAALEGAIFAWRARSLTYCAELDRTGNDRAFVDAERAIKILRGLPPSPAIARDLAHAELHLARAHLFKAHASWLGRRHSFAAAKEHAQEALRLGGATDPYTKSEGEWVVAHAK